MKPDVKPFRGKLQILNDHPELEKSANELVQLKQTLKENNELINLILQTISLGMDIVDEHGNILFQNGNLEKQFGRKAIGQKCWDLYRDDQSQCEDCPLLEGINIGKTKLYETKGILGGKTIQISYTGMLYMGKKAILEIFQDITERNLYEFELKAAKVKAEESNRSKSAFLVSMGHEIKTPMNAIMGFSDLMVETEGDEMKQFAAIVQKCSKQLLLLIDDVLHLSRLQSGKMPVDNIGFKPAELVTDVYRMFNLPHLKKELDITISIPEQYEKLIILSDAGKIRQVLTNFAANAVKFTSEGSVELGFDLQNGFVEFYVTDTGIGIPEKEQQRIFDSFYRSEQAVSSAIEGTGLGLSIAKELVELMGGVIGVSSEQNKGSRFFFSIPLEKSDKRNSGKPKSGTDQKEFKDFTILIAEDVQVHYQYIEILLKDKVNRIDYAANGKEAVELALKNSYNLILMDLKMPVMGGIEATKILRLQFPDIPIIAQTAYSLPEEKEKALQAGCTDFLSKPFKKKELIEVINRYM
jgi:signal transduction histidine kinase/CheY-like chemotaxis protein